jgi:hypothetical protein
MFPAWDEAPHKTEQLTHTGRYAGTIGVAGRTTDRALLCESYPYRAVRCHRCSKVVKGKTGRIAPTKMTGTVREIFVPPDDTYF